jgi:colanic acid/amylovoran biosynthesis glycosyltransferase
LNFTIHLSPSLIVEGLHRSARAEKGPGAPTEQRRSRREADLKIAFYLGKFPILSQTFVLNQITGMIDRGLEVTLYAGKVVHHETIPSEIVKYSLLDRVKYVPAIPPSYAHRLLKAEWLAFSKGRWRRQMPLLRALNVKKYGRYAASLRLFYAAVPPLPLPAYDVIHAQFGPLGLKALALRQIGALRGKLVTSFRGFDATSRLKSQPQLFSELFREGDLFLPVSRSLRQKLIDHGCDEEKIVVHHSGIDCEKFRFAERRPNGMGTVRIIAVGRFAAKKGLSYAIRAVGRLVASGRKASFTIVGDGELRSEMEELIAELGLAGTVRLPGWQPHSEVISLMRDAHILIAPSVTAHNGDQEGIPNSVKEAMAMGLPVVSTVHGGIPELVDDGISGFLVAEKDVEALADRLAFLHDRPDTWPEMGRAGRAKVEKEFDINILNDQLVQLYSRLCNEKKSSPLRAPAREPLPQIREEKDGIL